MTNNVIETKQPLTGRVATILTERELTINIGSEKGVKPGMKFIVLSNEPVQIIDPMTKIKLGEVDREKVRVMATEVEAQFSICKTYKKRIIQGFNFTLPQGLLGPRREIPETLKVQDAQFPLPISEKESYVKVGDRVTQLLGDDDP